MGLMAHCDKCGNSVPHTEPGDPAPRAWLVLKHLPGFDWPATLCPRCVDRLVHWLQVVGP